jgi:hypothetical protein
MPQETMLLPLGGGLGYKGCFQGIRRDKRSDEAIQLD